MPFRPAVFLDRDDTLNENASLPDEAFPGKRGDLYLPEFVRLLPGVHGACVDLKRAGFVLVVVTNQACVARGTAAIADIERTNDRLRALLPDPDGSGESVIDAIYYAPHHPTEAVVEAYRSGPGTGFEPDHPWRKPGPGMLLAAAAELELDLGRSWMVGDKDRDVLAGVNAGLDPARCLRVGMGEGCDFPGLPGAAAFVLRKRAVEVGPEGDRADQPGLELRFVEATTVRLAAGNAPLAEAGVRETVESAARAIAERTGVELLALETDEGSVTATIVTHRLGAMAFMAELRRATNRWHENHRGGPIWPERH